MPESFSPFSGALIAGGRSRRMGRDKALCVREGEAFWSRQWRLLAEAGAAERFVCGWWREEFPDSVECIPDPSPDSGPLGGIVSALERATLPSVLVLAVDMPLVDLQDLRDLLLQSQSGAGCVGFREDDGRRFYEPLVAVYPRSLSGLARERLFSGDSSLQSFVRLAVRRGELREFALPDATATRFRSFNHPADLEPTG